MHYFKKIWRKTIVRSWLKYLCHSYSSTNSDRFYSHLHLMLSNIMSVQIFWKEDIVEFI